MPLRALRLTVLRLALPASFVTLGSACGPDTTPEAMDDGSSGSAGETTAGAPPATTMPGTTAMGSTGTPSDDTASTPGESDSSAGSSDEAGFIPRPDVGAPGDGTALGEQCEADRDCASRSCFLFPGGGFGLCSECALDSDCMMDDGPGTCSLGQGWAVCTGGEAGSMCQSSDGCAGDLVCAPIIEANPFNFCSACATDAECDEGSACTPGFTMGNYCATPGTIEIDEPCPEAGGAYCLSTHCTEALYDDMPTGLYLCGACTADTDCEEGQVCSPAIVTNMSFSGSVCM